MSSRPKLLVDWCGHDAAKHACEHWHYTRRLPEGKTVRIGVWEGGVFIGAIVFGRGSNLNIGSRYGLRQTEVCELVRVALARHAWPVSRIMRFAIQKLRQQSPGLRLLVSYADPDQGHHGGIYQATGWVYIGRSEAQSHLVVNGQPMHKRSASSKFGTHSIDKLRGLGIKVRYGAKGYKHTYCLPLDDNMRALVERMRKPYPKRAASIESDAPGDQPGEGGTIPTAVLQ